VSGADVVETPLRKDDLKNVPKTLLPTGTVSTAEEIAGGGSGGVYHGSYFGGCGWFTNFFMSCFSGMQSMKFSTY
jgi:hypothetical protein